MDSLRRLRSQERIIKNLTRELEECHYVIETQSEYYKNLYQEDIDNEKYILNIYKRNVIDLVCLIVCIFIILFI
jgi:hypothetical protein